MPFHSHDKLRYDTTKNQLVCLACAKVFKTGFQIYSYNNSVGAVTKRGIRDSITMQEIPCDIFSSIDTTQDRSFFIKS